jgi:anti-sigma regulatory factor (Ser/Thr protein kinase)
MNATRNPGIGNQQETTPPPRLEHTMRSVPLAVPALRRAARGFASDHGAGYELQLTVSVAVSEAVGNAVRHAYDPSRPGPVILTATTQDSMLLITVRDLGKGFQEGSPSGGLGLGLKLIAESAADMEIRQAQSGTELSMRFVLPS